MQELPAKTRQRLPSVGEVSGYRVARRREVNANLVRAPGFERRFNQ